jgi:hypothetical protein
MKKNAKIFKNSHIFGPELFCNLQCIEVISRKMKTLTNPLSMKNISAAQICAFKRY